MDILININMLFLDWDNDNEIMCDGTSKIILIEE